MDNLRNNKNFVFIKWNVFFRKKKNVNLFISIKKSTFTIINLRCTADHMRDERKRRIFNNTC